MVVSQQGLSIQPTANDRSGLATNLPHFTDQFLEIRHLVQRIHLCPCDLARFVDNEGRALTDSRYRGTFSQNSELLGNGCVGIEIGAHRNLDFPDIFLLPRDMTGYGINADVQDLGIQIRELEAPSIEFRDLRCSSGSPIQRMKRDNHALFAAIIAQPDFKLALARNRRQGKIRCGIACFECHLSIDLEIIYFPVSVTDCVGFGGATRCSVVTQKIRASMYHDHLLWKGRGNEYRDFS